MPRERRHRGPRILLGIAVMIVLVAGGFWVLSRFAGGWGVPYFSFTTDRGSLCTNDFTGYHCDNVSKADVQWWGDLDLPDSAVVHSSHYKSTHDFNLDAVVTVPKADAAKTYASLRKTFGACQSGHPTQLDTTGLAQVCVMANDASDTAGDAAPLADTLYEITTGVQKDGALVIGIHEESR
ncbi:hypothetical protein FOE78_16180 [Microlunatus elymi]|uniref:Uncharacterized protein n=1 Tax=Microlunatus elymi TaxID=2596828 RepID=A0A516Q1E7_9ACTN|nr:hypothetical protein [Microlunatus elymi]QDP97257.1 hypothetical protein FOE78_16180 [Microlunatus elymi]